MFLCDKTTALLWTLDLFGTDVVFFRDRENKGCHSDADGVIWSLSNLVTHILDMSDNIETQVVDVIVEQLGVDREKVTPDAKLIDDLGADSLDTVELVMTLEERFSVDVPDEDAEKLRTVSEVVAYIKEHKQN